MRGWVHSQSRFWAPAAEILENPFWVGVSFSSETRKSLSSGSLLVWSLAVLSVFIVTEGRVRERTHSSVLVAHKSRGPRKHMQDKQFRRWSQNRFGPERELSTEVIVPLIIPTISSDRPHGGVLIQEGHPVAFENRKLKEVELELIKINRKRSQLGIY